MAQFGAESFSGTIGGAQTLQAYSAAWSKQAGWTQDAHIGVSGQYACNFSNVGGACYQHSGVPASADYTVSADITRTASGSTPPQMGVCARMQAGVQTLYFAVYTHSSTNVRLFKFVAGTQTQLGASYTLTLGTSPRNLRLRVHVDQISVELDGATIIGPVTDAAISGAGKAGIYLFSMRETGVADTGTLDNYSADDIGATSALSGNVTLDAVTAAGTLADAGGSSVTGGVTLADVLAAGTLGTAPGTVTIPGLTNWSGGLQAGITVPVVTACRLTDGVQTAILVNQLTNGAGDLAITHAALVPGTWYMVTGWSADGSSRFARPVLAV